MFNLFETSAIVDFSIHSFELEISNRLMVLALYYALCVLLPQQSTHLDIIQHLSDFFVLTAP